MQMFNTANEKKGSGYFRYFAVSNLRECLRLLADLARDGYCFRGQRDGLWPIVSSAQRKWQGWRCKECAIKTISYKDYLAFSLQAAKDSAVFPNCSIARCDRGLRDHERWGFLQHYSWPTPFVDFSTNYDVALYMAVRGIHEHSSSGFFSIYAIRPDCRNGDENIDWDEWVQTNARNEGWYNFSKWRDVSCLIMRKDDKKWCNLISRDRMASQGGLFVYMRDDNKSLEELFSEKSRLEKNEIEITSGMEHERIICIDIPYDWVLQVKAYCFDREINDHALGLSDTTIDDELKSEYKKFEKDFLNKADFLERTINWSKHTYARFSDCDCFGWNKRNFASVFIKDGRSFCEGITQHPRGIIEVLRDVATQTECTEGEIYDDFSSCVGGLSGLVDVLPGKRSAVTCDAIGNEHAIIPPETDAFHMFYGEGATPSELHIDLTDCCTEKCVHCYVPHNQNNILEYALVEKVLNEFRAINGLTVYLTGGECMLHPRFEQICRLCAKLELNIIILSNLSACNEERVKLLKEIDPQFINVSLYSMNADEHDAITQVTGSWQKTMDAILACEKAGLHIRLSAPLLKKNRTAFPALKKFADEHRMHLISSFDIVPRTDHNCTNLDYACSVEELETVLLSNRVLFDRGWNGVMPKPDDKVCDIGLSRLYLSAEGNYYPCDCMHDYIIGSAVECTVKEVWNGKKLNCLRALKNIDFGKCSDCEHRPYCKVCPAFNFNGTRDLYKTIPEKCAVSEVVHRVFRRRSE